MQIEVFESAPSAPNQLVRVRGGGPNRAAASGRLRADRPGACAGTGQTAGGLGGCAGCGDKGIDFAMASSHVKKTCSLLLEALAAMAAILEAMAAMVAAMAAMAAAMAALR